MTRRDLDPAQAQQQQRLPSSSSDDETLPGEGDASSLSDQTTLYLCVNYPPPPPAPGLLSPSGPLPPLPTRMKTEDDPSASPEFISSVPPVPAHAHASDDDVDDDISSPAHSCPSAATVGLAAAATAATAAPDDPANPAPALISSSSSRPRSRPAVTARRSSRRADQRVCDLCRERRIKCDYKEPCAKCIDANITCKRTYVPQKRGPKKGQGKVINAIRARERQEAQVSSAANPSPHHAPSWPNNAADARNAPEPTSLFTSDQYQPLHRPYIQLIPRCLDLYYEHIYPIMPMLHIRTIRSMIQRPMTDPEKTMIYALCAVVCLHMSGKSLHVDGPESWEEAGRFFLDECVSMRTRYDYMEDNSLETVLTSFWLSISFFEINRDTKSWRFLREALTFAEDMGLHDDATYRGLSPTETLCRQRVFWILFVTERSFAVLRKRPLTFKRTPSLPTTRHAYESPDIHTGFLQLVSSYTPLDESFVSAWNHDSNPRVSATTYLALQNILAQPPSFLQRSRASSPSSDDNGIYSAPVTAAPSPTGSDEDADEEIVQSEPTAIQKADLLITQQWLRLIVWQSSSKHNLLSWNSPHESMNCAFPLEIARATANVLQSLPSSAVEVHGMGIFEKIFQIGNCCMNVLADMDQRSAARSSFGGFSGGAMGMDFVGAGDLGVLGLGRRGVSIDPFEVFVRTLSATPNSRTQFANTLLAVAQQRPGVMKMALTPSLEPPALQPEPLSWSTGLSGVSNAVPMDTNMLDDVIKEENEIPTDGSNGWSLGDTLSLDGGGAPASSLLSGAMLDFNTPPFHNAPGGHHHHPPNNQRQPALASFSIPSLDTSVQPVSGWANETSAAAAATDWSSYDNTTTSPTMDSSAATYSSSNNNASAYSSAAGTPIGSFTFSRQDSGDSSSSSYQYQPRQQQQHHPYFGTAFHGGGGNMNNGNGNNGKGDERTMRTHRFLGNFEWPRKT